MRHHFTLFLTGLCLFLAGMAQPVLQLRTGRLQLQPAASLSTGLFYRQQTPVEGRRFVVVRFAGPLTNGQQELLMASGISLQAYLPPDSYTATMDRELSRAELVRAAIRQIGYLPPQLKISPPLQQPERYRWLQGQNGLLQVLIKINGITPEAAIRQLAAKQFTVQPSALAAYHILQASLPVNRLVALAENPFVEWIEPAHPADKPLNSISRQLSGAGSSAAATSAGGYGLTGAGVVAGVGDNADPADHIDLADRIINRAGAPYSEHGTHVSGTIAGSGILRYLSRGFAPAATIVSQLFGGIWLQAATYINDFGMVVTNNSYGNIVSDPGYEGVYDLYSQVMDEQAYRFPELLHVFAAGNDGMVSVPPYPAHYGTVLSSYQSAKNVISVGNADHPLYASIYSSSGPVQDGRLKPELVALGDYVVSTLPGNNYAGYWGTSMAAPAVTGATALLCEQYRKQFGSHPPSSLVKTLLLNGSQDIGTAGVDFRHGYGMLNVHRSLGMLKNQQFFTNNITTGTTQTRTIAVPANTTQLKLMLYWHDPPAALYATRTLVNDLDLEVTDPQGNVFLPQRLDTVASSVDRPATTGPDHINNSEQILVQNPVAGNYTIRIKGTAVNVNPSQPYTVAYDFLPRGLRLYAPFETEAFFPGDLMIIRWEDAGTSATNTRTLEYSLDDGATWNLLNSNIPAGVLYYDWDIPGNMPPSAQVRMRLTENGTSFSATSGRCTILGRPAFAFAGAGMQCEGYCTLQWPAVPGATDYEVLIKKGPDLQPIATTTGTSYTVSALDKDSTYWFSVRARINGVPGKRSDGQAYRPAGGSCSGNISNGDLKLDAILGPGTGRQFSNTALGSNSTIHIRVKNLDDEPVAAYTVQYSINGGAPVSRQITTPLAAGSTATIQFTGADFSATRIYHIRAEVKNTQPDAVAANDTLSRTIKQLANAPVSLNTFFIEHFESATAATYEAETTGLEGLDRWDFSPLAGNNDRYGRLRSFVNTGIARGNRGLTVDVRKFVDPAHLGTNRLTGTFNLGSYQAATDEVRTDFLYKQHGPAQQDAASGKNRVLIRGSETDPEQTIYDLAANQPVQAGQWKRSQSIEVSDLLTAAGQQFSPTTQLIFTQTSSLGMGDDTHSGGYTFDDVRWYTVASDLQLVAIDSPAVQHCALGTVPVVIRIKNSMSYPISNVPVKLQVDNGPAVTETIGSIAANTTISYRLAAPADLSVVGPHTIRVWADLPADNFRENDTLTKGIVNQPVITRFPYLEDFENGAGYFYTGGQNSSWAYGTPNGARIRQAASGSKAWKTGLTTTYNDAERSYLYSPCFDISRLTRPILSFAIANDIEYCRPDACDGAWMEYSTDGENWIKLGSAGSGTNWYNNANRQFWDSSRRHWHVATTALPSGMASLRLRFVLQSDPFTSYDGIAIDDIHVYDQAAAIFSGPGNSNLITQPVAGSNTAAFTDNNQLVAQLLPNGNHLGSTGVQTWLYNGPIRTDQQHYYAARNFVVQPGTDRTSSPVTARLYFTDAEVDSLRQATGCATCPRLKDYTEIGIVKYDDPDHSRENGTMADNQAGSYAYFNHAVVRKIPYDRGYYAEVNLNRFSEFWLTDGHPTNSQLPVQWILFTAQRSGKDAVLDWSLQQEQEVLQYEVERLVPGATAYQRIATLQAIHQQPVSSYFYTDTTAGKKGVYQYRIRRTDRNGQFSYSETRTLLFGDKSLNVVVYPNPATSTVQVLLQGIANSPVQLLLYDASGKLLLQQQAVANGDTQKLQLNIAGLPAGIYPLQVQSGNEQEIIRLVKPR